MSSLTIDINGICNERCTFCYQNLDGSILPEEEIFRLVDGSKAQTVQIGGGEPFLDPRIIRVIKGLRERDKRVHISTNATRIPQGLLELEERVRENVQIQASLHASTPELYDQVHRPVEGSGKNMFGRVLGNVQKIKPQYSTVISSTIYQANLEDVPNLVELASQLDLPIRFNLAFPEGAGKEVDRLTARQVDQLRGYLLGQRILRGNKVESPIIHTNNCGALTLAYGIGKKGACPVDCGKKYVSPRGEQYGCEFLRGTPVQVSDLTAKEKS